MNPGKRPSTTNADPTPVAQPITSRAPPTKTETPKPEPPKTETVSERIMTRGAQKKAGQGAQPEPEKPAQTEQPKPTDKAPEVTTPQEVKPKPANIQAKPERRESAPTKETIQNKVTSPEPSQEKAVSVDERTSQEKEKEEGHMEEEQTKPTNKETSIELETHGKEESPKAEEEAKNEEALEEEAAEEEKEEEEEEEGNEEAEEEAIEEEKPTTTAVNQGQEVKEKLVVTPAVAVSHLSDTTEARTVPALSVETTQVKPVEPQVGTNSAMEEETKEPPKSASVDENLSKKSPPGEEDQEEANEEEEEGDLEIDTEQLSNGIKYVIIVVNCLKDRKKLSWMKEAQVSCLLLLLNNQEIVQRAKLLEVRQS